MPEMVAGASIAVPEEAAWYSRPTTVRFAKADVAAEEAHQGPRKADPTS